MSLDVRSSASTSSSSRPTPSSSLTRLKIPPVPVQLDEPATQGITIQPPTAPLPTTAKTARPHRLTKPDILDTIPPGKPANTSVETPLYPSPGTVTGLSSGSINISPSSRHPLTRPLSPDLPTRDALYLFSNFASYMHSPDEGPEGIISNEDFKDTVRLLDYARPNSNVRILHLKYRFLASLQDQPATYGPGNARFPTQARDGRGRLRNPVPQPFSVARDPVIKVDYQENGVFDPLPAQAVFDHIAKVCYPPPRLIVVSFVNSIVTQNHIAQLSTWALTSSPPCFIFSPLETRLRVSLPIHLALHHAIPMSMYATPEPGSSPYNKPSPSRSVGGGTAISRHRHCHSPAPVPALHAASHSSSQGGLKRRHSEHSLPQTGVSSSRERVYPRDPIASLTIISTPHTSTRPSTSTGLPQSQDASSAAGSHPPPQTDRLPLWALAPGMNVLQGSTSASIGIKLGDFSALNLVNKDHENIDALGKALVGSRSRLNHHAGEVWIDSSPLKALVPPVVGPLSRPSTPASKILDDSDARSIRSTTSQRVPVGGPTVQHQQQQQHLTPPELFTPPNLFAARPTAGSFPRLARIPHWKRGRKELPEDVLEELGLGLEVESVLDGMRNLGMWDLEHALHADRVRRASEDPGGPMFNALSRGHR